jgi:hypothetical protein
MIITDKIIEQYYCTCEYGNWIEFASNQPAGGTLFIICKCYNSIPLTFEILEDGKNKYVYKMREDTRRIREGIIEIFQGIGGGMTVRQVFYQTVGQGIVPKDESSFSSGS